jgi:hypothetical protein
MHIFISYAKKDTRDLAIWLADSINDIPGLTAWMDRSLEVGGEWTSQIEEEIDRCDLMKMPDESDTLNTDHTEKYRIYYVEMRAGNFVLSIEPQIG